MTKILKCINITFLAFTLCACSLKEIKKQSVEIDNIGEIAGQVIIKENAGDSKTRDSKTRDSIVVAVITYNNEISTIVDQRHLNEEGEYQFNLLSGNYMVGAYIDANDNLIRDENEIAAMYRVGTDQFSNVTLGNKQQLTLPPIVIDKKTNLKHSGDVNYNIDKIDENMGKIVNLNDDIFTREYSNMGLWRPVDFLTEVGGGLMFLQPFDKNKTPVIFIHGISGSPNEFQYIIQKLDKEKFQPWVFYYPSGVPLDLVSTYMLTAVTALHEKYNFTDIQLISHSMGGLITREFLQKQKAVNSQFNTSLYVTINSPMNGLESAERGVKQSPIVVASWRDLAANSDYIKLLHQTPIPKGTPYHLFFSYLEGEDGDGNVPMSSQLSLSLQNEAKRIYATQGSHAGVLQNEHFINRLLKVMKKPNE
jgi:uncharacterized alpha/beta hydrolase family protein